ncbi:VWA domain-containing protein [Actinoplanes sp. NPDC051411]|uniref:VWA domain-containing protein n=1 Tax=Actinoplanes sp. NPDC051411 TaxID=3155522 RepID=UPI0034348A4B
MSLSWPWALLALLAVPLLPAVRWWLNRRRKRSAITVSSVALIKAALPGRTAWRRKIPAYLFLAGLLPLAAALARPQATVSVPADNTSILLALDVSGSMCSTDVRPNRLAAASDAARKFIKAQKEGTKIGLVAFSGIAGLLVPPTTDQGKLLDAIDGLKTARGTAIGQGILTSIDAIAEINPNVTKSGVDLGDQAPGRPGNFQPDTIVVLTDGSNTTGVDPVTAAQQAAARHLRVFTIGFGTTNPSSMVCSASQIGDDGAFGPRGGGGFGGFGGYGGRARVQEIDEDTLQKVADTTGGRYFRAQDAGKLNDILSGLPKEIGLHQEHVEISSWFVLVGALLVFSGVGLSLWWNRGPALSSNANLR